MKKTDLNRFNTGGSHKSNPLGGIPQGTGQNGKMNTVQEGETSKGDFVFSDDVKLTKDVIKQYNLPANLEGKTVADATKFIDNKFKDRTDKISTSTKTGMLDGIAAAQEAIKAKQAQLSQAFEANSTDVPDMMDGQAPQGFEEFLPQQNQMFLGGFGGGSPDASGGTGSAPSGMLQGLGAAGMGMGDGGFADRYNYDPKLKAQYNQMEGVKDSVAGAIGPWGQLFRGIEKGGKSIGTAIGGETGGDVASGILDPFSGQMETFKNKDATGWEKAGVIAAPFLSGVIAGGARKRTQQRMSRDQHIAAGNTEFTNDFALGGSTRPQIGSVTDTDAYKNLLLNQDLVNQYSTQSFLNPTPTITALPSYTPTTYDNTPTKMGTMLNNAKNTAKKGVDWLGENYGSILRYAPVAGNALQLAKLKRPGYESLARLNNRFTPDYVDEKSLQNIVGNEYDNAINGLTGAANGSQGALRSSLLGASLNKTKALSDAYLNASAQNRAQNMQGQQFNLGVDQVNLNQSNQELDINDRNKAAYDTNKSRLQAALFEDVGNIGKEEVYKKMAKEMFGYKWDGKYWVKPDGSTATDSEVKAEIDSKSTNSKKLGGMLIKNKKKY